MWRLLVCASLTCDPLIKLQISLLRGDPDEAKAEAELPLASNKGGPDRSQLRSSEGQHEEASLSCSCDFSGTLEK